MLMQEAIVQSDKDTGGVLTEKMNVGSVIHTPDQKNSKDYLLKLNNEIENLVVYLTEIHKMIQAFYAQVNKEKEFELQQQIAKQIASQKFYADIEDHLERAKQMTEVNSTPVKEEGENVAKTLSDILTKLVAKKKVLEEQITQVEINLSNPDSELNKKYRERKQQAIDKVVAEIKKEEIVVKDIYGAAVSAETVGKMLTDAQQTRPAIAQALTKSELRQQLLDLLTLDKKKVIGQMENKTRLMEEIDLLGQLGGKEATPIQMLSLISLNKKLLDVYQKIGSATEDKLENEKDISTMFAMVQDLQEKKSELSKNIDMIDQVKESLSKLDTKLNEINNNTPRPK